MGSALVSRVLRINGEDRRIWLYCEIDFRSASPIAILEIRKLLLFDCLRREHSPVEAVDGIDNPSLI
jgi:hypothetical protein